MPRRWSLLLVVASACSFGAGPVIGYGERGLVLGGEAGGGMLGLEATAGYESGFGYARLDWNEYGSFHSFDRSVHPVMRLGLGAGFTTTTRPDGYEEFDWHAMPIAGGGAMLSSLGAVQACQQQQAANAFSATLELRYAGHFEVVIVPRYVRITPFCGFSE